MVEEQIPIFFGGSVLAYAIEGILLTKRMQNYKYKTRYRALERALKKEDA